MLNINQRPFDENGNPHGEWFYYHNNGNLWYRHNYFYGITHGFCEGHNYNDVLEYRGYVNMGKKVGYWNWYCKKRYYLWLI